MSKMECHSTMISIRRKRRMRVHSDLFNLRHAPISILMFVLMFGTTASCTSTHSEAIRHGISAQDGSPRLRPRSASGQRVVLDEYAGLMWSTEDAQLPWDQAKDYCEHLTYAGYTDWRLPTKDEILSLDRILREEQSSRSLFSWSDVLYWSSDDNIFGNNGAGVGFGAEDFGIFGSR